MHWYMDFGDVLRLHGQPHARRSRLRAYMDAYDECEEKRNWTDMSPITACSFNRIACDQCLIRRHVVTFLDDDPFCPRSFNAESTEDCFHGLEEYNGLCEDCWLREEFGCGWGGHVCTQCVHDKHKMESIAVPCIHCGPCIHCELEGEFHCVATCMRARSILVTG